MIRTMIALSTAFLACALLASASGPQDGGAKWEPYKFKGNERYEYRFVTAPEGDNPKREVSYAIDIRSKSEEEFEVGWTLKAPVRKAEVGEKVLFGMWTEAAPALILMNPMYGAFISQVDLKEGEKMSLFGAGVVKVGAAETVGGRSGLTCRFFIPNEKKEDVLSFECTIDRDLALPIKSINYEEGKEKSRAELVSYKKD